MKLGRQRVRWPAEQARILRLLIEQIHVGSDGISVTLHAPGILSITGPKQGT